MNAESAWRFFGIRVECAKDVGSGCPIRLYHFSFLDFNYGALFFGCSTAMGSGIGWRKGGMGQCGIGW